MSKLSLIFNIICALLTGLVAGIAIVLDRPVVLFAALIIWSVQIIHKDLKDMMK